MGSLLILLQRAQDVDPLGNSHWPDQPHPPCPQSPQGGSPGTSSVLQAGFPVPARVQRERDGPRDWGRQFFWCLKASKPPRV